MSNELRTVEYNPATTVLIEFKGIVRQIDFEKAPEIHEYEIGQAVRVLEKDEERCYQHSGVIVSLENFELEPMLTVAYINAKYGSRFVEIVYITKATEKFGILPQIHDYAGTIDVNEIVEHYETRLVNLKNQIKECENKLTLVRKMFLSKYSATEDAREKVST